MQPEEYLERIGILRSEKRDLISLEFLAELQNQHLLSVPFEDLDIPSKRINLETEKIFQKIITNKRGGFCYELNGLFHWMLVSFGFNVDMLSARVYNNRKCSFGPEFDHMTLLVHLNSDYLVDVGFGDSFRNPIKLPDGEVADISGHYRVLNYSEGKYELQKANSNSWEPQYCFSTIPRTLSDFKEMCDYQQDSPTSSFRLKMLCTIATKTGRITLTEDSLTITENGDKTRMVVENQDEFEANLFKYFNIKL
jgi:N-hydroxyarylamine O-acetyltransferase